MKSNIRVSRTAVIVPEAGNNSAPEAFEFRRFIQVYPDPPIKDVLRLAHLADVEAVFAPATIHVPRGFWRKGTRRAWAARFYLSTQVESPGSQDFPDQNLMLAGTLHLSRAIGQIVSETKATFSTGDEPLTDALQGLPVPEGFRSHLLNADDLPSILLDVDGFGSSPHDTFLLREFRD